MENNNLLLTQHKGYTGEYQPEVLPQDYLSIWQGNLEINVNVLIGSFLVGILLYGPFTCKLCIFCFRKPANSKQAWPECLINYLLT